MALNRSVATTIATKIATSIETPLVSLLPQREMQETAFLIGCGRSGTTIFGECLAHHSSITYLHEPREFWAMAFPATDIWTRSAQKRGGRLVLNEDDFDPAGAERLRRVFQFQVWKTGRPVLVEKLPINNFRIGLLTSVFPEGRFVHLLRDGREVARSIQRRADNPRNHWWGRNEYKWRQLAEVAESRGLCESADELCTNNYERGLLEWRLSMEMFNVSSMNAKHLLEVSYNGLVEAPMETLENVLEFLNLESCPIMLRYVEQNLKRRTQKIDTCEFTEKERLICGEHLDNVMERLSQMHDERMAGGEAHLLADSVGPVISSDDTSSLHSLQSAARVPISVRSPEATGADAPAASLQQRDRPTSADDAALSSHDGGSPSQSAGEAGERAAETDPTDPTDPTELTESAILRRKPGILRRFLMGIGVLYAFGPHLWIIKLLGPRLGIRWARGTAHAHWALTWLGIHRQTRRALERLKSEFQTDLSISQMLHRHLLLKHQSFAEWRLAVTPSGRRYISEVYELPQSFEDTIRKYHEEGVGVLFVVYHYGMYKVLASAMAEQYDTDIYKANYLSAHYRASTLGPIAQWAFRNAVHTNQASGTKDIYLRPDSAPVALIKRLKRGKLVGIAADGMISDEFAEVSFLDGTMKLPSGWAKLAAVTNSVVVTLFVSLESAHKREIHASDPFFVEDTPDSIHQAVQTCATHLEEHVAKQPWQWHIWHRVEFREDEQGKRQMSSQPMVVNADAFHYEKAPK